MTIVLLTHHRLELIKLCLKSIEMQDSHGLDYEIVALLNGVDNESEEFLRRVSNDDQRIKFLNIKDSIPVGEARNKVICEAQGDYLCFIDDDVEIAKNYFHEAEKIIKDKKEWDLFGGPDRNKEKSSTFQKVLSEVMQSFFAMGPTAKRHSVDSETKGYEVNLILCNLWMKKEIFDQGYSFPKGYIRNEENILIAQLDEAGKKLLYTPRLLVYHERKESFKKLIRVTYLSGLYRTFGFFDSKKTISFWFFIPQLFLLTLITALLINFPLGIQFLSLYIIIVFSLSLYHMVKIGKIASTPVAMIFYFIYNLIYPLGQFRGYLKRIMVK